MFWSHYTIQYSMWTCWACRKCWEEKRLLVNFEGQSDWWVGVITQLEVKYQFFENIHKSEEFCEIVTIWLEEGRNSERLLEFQWFYNFIIGNQGLQVIIENKCEEEINATQIPHDNE